MEYEEQEDEFDLNERSTAAPEDATDEQPLRVKVDVCKRRRTAESEAAGSEDLLFLIAVRSHCYIGLGTLDAALFCDPQLSAASACDQLAA